MAEPFRTVLSKTLAEMLFPDNAFYRNALRDGGTTGISIDAKVVEIPEEGLPPNVIIDPTTFPLSATRRVDVANNYITSLFVTNPTVITNDEEVLTSFDKQKSVLVTHANVLNTAIADHIGYFWAETKGQFFVTTSSDTRPATAPGGGGDRKKVAKDDIMKIAEWFDRQNIPMEDRYAVFPSDMYYDLLDIPEFSSYEKTGRADILATGVLGEMFGFKIMKRSYVVYYNMSDPANPVLVPVGGSGGNESSHAAIFWQRTTARYAYGKPEVFVNSNRGEYLGTVINAAVRSGGRASYNDGKGVAVLIQDIAI